MVDITQYNIYRIATEDIRNEWNEIVHYEGTLLHCTEDLNWCFLAKVPGSAATPRMLPKKECRQLTDAELEVFP